MHDGAPNLEISPSREVVFCHFFDSRQLSLLHLSIMSAPPAPRGRGRGRGKTASSEDPSSSRPAVGGLLAMERDTKPVLPGTTAGPPGRGGMKFKPNMVRKKPVVRDDDEDDEDEE